MARFSVSDRQTGTKTSVRGPTLVAGANDAFTLREVGVFSTVATESRVSLRFLTAAGTAGTGLDEVPWRLSQASAASAAASQVPSTDHTAVAGFIRNVVLPAQIGGGIIWTFGPEGLLIPEGTGNGVFLGLPGGTDQVIDFYFDWEE
jgi:hypothetical protein